MVARRIKINRRSVTGFFPSPKAGRMLAFESTLERDFFVLCEFDNDVAFVDEQPVVIPYARAGRWYSHVPDALVTFTCERRPQLVQVKYRSELFKKWSLIHPALRAAARFARKRGWTFKIWTEHEIRTPLLKNVAFLLPLRSQPMQRSDVELALDTIEGLPEPTISLLLQNLEARGVSPAKARSLLWATIAHQLVDVDFAKPMTGTTKLQTRCLQ